MLAYSYKFTATVITVKVDMLPFLSLWTWRSWLHIINFVVDESTATGESNFQLFRDYIRQVASEVNIGPCNNQVAVISFNDSLVLWFNQPIHSPPYSSNSTDISVALDCFSVISQNGTLLSSQGCNILCQYMDHIL